MQENRSVNHYLGWFGAENEDFDAHQHDAFPDRARVGTARSSRPSWGAEGRNDYPAGASRTRPTVGAAAASSATAGRATAGSTRGTGTTSTP